jgi:hypothetical protein
MGARKIQDEQEVIRWFEEGRTYDWMIQKYREKYNIETVPSMWGNFRRRRGLARRIARDDELIPWEVKREHRWDYPIMMLRQEARKRAGFELTDEQEHGLAAWKRNIEEDGTVVHYDPDTEQGWFYVPRREGIDVDLIRHPERKTTLRLAAD